MTDSNSSRNDARDKAAAFFKEKADRKTVLYQEMETERLLADRKTAKLRALRLAKEEAEREDADRAGRSGSREVS